MTPDLTSTLLDWYDRSARDLPWRVSPVDRKAGVRPDPYRVWLSEIMLQQTTVATVGSRYRQFMQRWPTVAALAEADTADVMAAWAGLGYYARARNLKSCADQIVAVHGGGFPGSAAELAALPGLGAYTSAAIAAICYDEPIPVVDGNVERVVARMIRIPVPVQQAKADIRTFVHSGMPSRSGDYAQALMDIGATICTPKSPRCCLCPLQSGCAVAGSQEAVSFPVKPARKAKPIRHAAAFVIQAENSVLLRRRPETGLLAGMAELPCSDFKDRAGAPSDLIAAAPFEEEWQICGVLTHIFTHFRLELTVFHCRLDAPMWMTGYWWQPLDQMADAGLPTVFTKALILAENKLQETN